MEIRRATSGDADVLADLHVKCWQEAYVGQLPQEYLDGLTVGARLEMWQRLLKEDVPADTFVAVVGSESVAFITVGVTGNAAGRPTGSVNAIYARARYWGCGVGRLLMERGLQALSDRGCDEATLWVLETNSRARRFYEMGGWQIDDSRVEEIGGAAVTELRLRLSLRS